MLGLAVLGFTNPLNIFTTVLIESFSFDLADVYVDGYFMDVLKSLYISGLTPFDLIQSKPMICFLSVFIE